MQMWLCGLPGGLAPRQTRRYERHPPAGARRDTPSRRALVRVHAFIECCRPRVNSLHHRKLIHSWRYPSQIKTMLEVIHKTPGSILSHAIPHPLWSLVPDRRKHQLAYQRKARSIEVSHIPIPTSHHVMRVTWPSKMYHCASSPWLPPWHTHPQCPAGR